MTFKAQSCQIEADMWMFVDSELPLWGSDLLTTWMSGSVPSDDPLYRGQSNPNHPIPCDIRSAGG